MENDPSVERSGRFDEIERLLTEQGHDLGFCGARVAAGRSGVAVGFPKEPMLHVSWWWLSALVLGRWLWRRAATARASRSASASRTRTP